MTKKKCPAIARRLSVKMSHEMLSSIDSLGRTTAAVA